MSLEKKDGYEQLSHAEVPGFRKVFKIVLLLCVLWLWVIMCYSQGANHAGIKSSIKTYSTQPEAEHKGGH